MLKCTKSKAELPVIGAATRLVLMARKRNSLWLGIM